MRAAPVFTGLLLALSASTAAAQGRWPALSQPVVEAGGGEGDAAVVIGVESYLAVPGVPGAVQNAADWYTHLTKGLHLAPSKVELLRNNEATLEKMRKHIARAAGAVKPGGTLWFVFIGHGAPAQDGRDGILIGADAQQDPDSLYARSLPKKELLELLARGAQKRTVVVLDACFSGRSGTGASLAPGLQPLIAVRERADTGKALVFSAGKADEFAGALPGVSRPAFSYLLLGALRGWGDADKDGRVTAAEATEYARDTLRAVVKDRNQTPELSGGAPGEILAVARESGPDIGAMVLASMPPSRAVPAEPAPLKPEVAHRATSPGKGTPSLDLAGYRPPPVGGSRLTEAQLAMLERLAQNTRDSAPDKPIILLRIADGYAAQYRTFTSQPGREADAVRSLGGAIKAFNDVTNLKTFAHADEALFRYATFLMSAKRLAEARKVFYQIIKERPLSAYVPEAYLAFGELFFDEGKVDLALQAYQQVEKYPKSRAAPYAIYKSAWCSWRLGKGADALERLADVTRAAGASTDESSRLLVEAARNDAARLSQLADGSR